MTLPASGTLAFSNVNTEVGTPGATRGFDWISANSKTAIKDMNSLYSKAWYLRNVDGNCTVNCAAVAAQGANLQCINCSVYGTVNCTNCDAQPFLQTNCNCVGPYNCTYLADVLYNCNCNCK